MLSLWVALSTLAPAQPAPKIEPPLYFPTKVGTKWVQSTPDGERTFEVTAVEEKDGATLVVVTQVVGRWRQVCQVVSVSERGLYRVEASDQILLLPPLCVLLLPHKPGDSWAHLISGPVSSSSRAP